MLLTIAWRNLWRHRTRSLAISASVALGVWAGAFIIALYYGMGNERVHIAIEQEVSHIQVHHPKFRDDYEVAFNFALDSIESALKETPGMKAYSLRTTVQGMLANASGSNGVQINGVDPEAEQATRGFRQFVINGDYLDTGKKNRVLVGKKLADKMKLTPEHAPRSRTSTPSSSCRRRSSTRSSGRPRSLTREVRSCRRRDCSIPRRA